MEFVRKNEDRILKLKYEEIGEKEKFPLLYFENLEKTGIVSHGFTTRKGGVSEGIFSELNLSFTRGDRTGDVTENFKRTARALHTQFERFVFSDQTHTTNVRKVTEADAGCGLIKPRTYKDVDGLITNVPGLTLSTFFADCVPLFFVDPIHHAIGMTHSGWRGTVGRIGAKTIQAMENAYGTRPEDIAAAIGPSICQDCYEVGEDVAHAFKREFPGQEQEILLPKTGGKYQLDLWKANEILLLEAGIRKSHLAVTNICTCCNPELLFSHRASHGKRGNLGGFLCLKEL